MKTTDKYAEKDNFSRIIRHKLENYTLPVEAETWDELEKCLDTKPEKKISLWPWISGISAAASIALVITFSQHKFFKETYYETRETTSLSYHAERAEKNVSEEENLSSTPLSSVQTQTTQQRSRQEVFVPEVSAIRQRDVISSETEVQKNEESSVSDEGDDSESPPANPNSKRGDPFIQKPIDPWKAKSKNTSLALHISSGGRLYTMNNIAITAEQGSYSTLRSSNEDIFNPDKYKKITHLPPFAIGLSVRKALNKSLSIESGLTYSYLYSIYEAKISTEDASVTLHYLGIPINLAVNLYPSSRNPWNIYFSAGGMVEKGLFAHQRYTANDYTNGGIQTVTVNKRIQGLQWSVQSAIGISYRFNRDYSVFLEPKIIYYLDNNQPFNIRAAYPVVPGIDVGIRHTW